MRHCSNAIRWYDSNFSHTSKIFDGLKFCIFMIINPDRETHFMTWNRYDAHKFSILEKLTIFLFKFISNKYKILRRVTDENTNKWWHNEQGAYICEPPWSNYQHDTLFGAFFPLQIWQNVETVAANRTWIFHHVKVTIVTKTSDNCKTDRFYYHLTCRVRTFGKMRISSIKFNDLFFKEIIDTLSSSHARVNSNAQRRQ